MVEWRRGDWCHRDSEIDTLKEEAEALETEIDLLIEAYWPLTDLREKEDALSGLSVLVDRLARYMRVETEKTGSTQTASQSTRSLR